MAAPFRPPWFGNIGVQVAAAGACLYNVVQLLAKLGDGRQGDAFLSFAWAVVFGYVLLESFRFRKRQQLESAAEDDRPADPAD